MNNQDYINDINTDDQKTLPMITLRGIVAFPHTTIHFDVQRDVSLKTLDSAMKGSQIVFLTLQKNSLVENPKNTDIYNIGVVAKLRQTLKINDEITRVLVEGIYRAEMLSTQTIDNCIFAEIKELNLNKLTSKVQKDSAEALIRFLKELFDEYSYLHSRIPQDMILAISEIKDPVYIVEYICSHVFFDPQLKQEILEENNIIKRLKKLCSIIEYENKIMAIEIDIKEKVKINVDQNQRDYYLREQLKVISQELGDDYEAEIEIFNQKLDKLKASDIVKNKLSEEIDKLFKMPQSSQEASVIRQYIETCLSLPFSIYTKDKLNIKNIEKTLNKDHYGMDKVKQRIVEMLAVRQLSPDIKGQIICLVGPPGVGKTSIAKSIANSMGRKYIRLSLGGVRDESDIRGHRKTYIGSMPGRIINGIKQAGSANPLMLLDEIDKLGSDFKGDPSSALLEVLDPEQNSSFVDHYIDLPFDLSKVLFITTANSLHTIPAPLLDRMEVINLSSYTRDEKFNIAKKHLITKQINLHGLNSKLIKINDNAIYSMLDNYIREPGVRNLEKTIAKLCRKSAKLIVDNTQKSVTISEKNISEFLGTQRYFPEKADKKDHIGIVNGLAWTSVGGEIMQIEVALMKGTGKIELTGSLGKVIKESALIAISHVRSNAEKYNINPDFYKQYDIHIHAPEGAVPKDGPSAGVTMVTALVSALTNKPVKSNVAMTGEITLRGRVLPIGGLKEKSMAAHRANIKTVLIPADNSGDLDEVDNAIKEATTFIPTDNIDKVLKTAILGFETKKLKSKTMDLDLKDIKIIPSKPDISHINITQ